MKIFSKKVVNILFSVAFIASLALASKFYLRFFAPNVNDREKYFYVHSGWTFNDVYKSIREKGVVQDSLSFVEASKQMGYRRIKPGKYRLHSAMGNRAFINMLKAGNQEPVSLRFHNLRLKSEFITYISNKLELDSSSLAQLLNSSSFLKPYGFTPENVYCMFIPNTYQLYWNISSEEFFKRMYHEYKKFWTPTRLEQARKIGLSPVQVSIMASIVRAEALHEDEMPMIAGLYMNRYSKQMKLEADPTVIFANGNFAIHRVLNKQLLKQSLYNTYLFVGLPPGPITMPSIKAINAVLAYTKHPYLYMCAKEDFSGYHNYAVTMGQHLLNAHRFQKALDKRNIKQ